MLREAMEEIKKDQIGVLEIKKLKVWDEKYIG